MSSIELQQLEQNIKIAQKIIDLGDSLNRLQSNRDFRKVILEGFFEDEAIRLVSLKADPNMQSPDQQKSILAQMDAIGGLRQFFQTVLVRADMARRSVEADEQTLDVLREEN